MGRLLAPHPIMKSSYCPVSSIAVRVSIPGSLLHGQFICDQFDLRLHVILFSDTSFELFPVITGQNTSFLYHMKRYTQNGDKVRFKRFEKAQFMTF